MNEIIIIIIIIICDRDTNCYWCTRIGTGTGGFGNKSTSRKRPNYSIIKIGKNTEKSPGDLRRLAVTQTPEKTISLHWCEKLFKEYDNNSSVNFLLNLWSIIVEVAESDIAYFGRLQNAHPFSGLVRLQGAFILGKHRKFNFWWKRNCWVFYFRILLFVLYLFCFVCLFIMAYKPFWFI